MLIGAIYLAWQQVTTPNETAAEPEPQPIEAPRVVPPAPKIYSPALERPQKGIADKVIDFLQGPCDPIIPIFKEAHQTSAVRPLVTSVIDEKHAGAFNLGQVCDAFDYLMDHWKLLDDPAGQELVCASAALWLAPGGDCDDFSVGISSALSSINGLTRVTFAYNAQRVGHAFTEVCLGRIDPTEMEEYIRARYNLSDFEDINTRRDPNGYVYLNLDWTAEYPGAPYFEAVHGVMYWPSIDHCTTF